MPSKDLNLALTEAVGEVTRKVKKGNKFTDGLDLSSTTDWASELRPSMKKLRQAMDGLLKTARLIHSVQRLHQDTKKITSNLAIMYRRDVCFSQAVSVSLLIEILRMPSLLFLGMLLLQFTNRLNNFLNHHNWLHFSSILFDLT
jgi:inositol polyphosphate-4-phosphatase